MKKSADWWRQAAIYQIYPRSFKDSDGDGLGDIKGITSKVDYLKSLCLDAVWLSPFYPSDLADGGYDVADYRNVDPRLGTLKDFDKMLKALHKAGICVFVDLPISTCGSKRRLTPRQDQKRASVTSLEMGAERMASFHLQMKFRTLRHQHGLAPQMQMELRASGTCTSLLQSNQISTGITAKSN